MVQSYDRPPIVEFMECNRVMEVFRGGDFAARAKSDTVGLLGRSLADLALLGDVLYGYDDWIPARA